MPQSTQSPTQSKGIFALLKGESGSGKSTGALSFGESIYVLDHDRKMPAIAQKHFPGKEIHYDTFDDVFQVGEALETLVNDCPYETIIGDSLTSLSYTALKTIDDVKGTNIIKMLHNLVATKGGKQQVELRGFDYYNGEDSFFKFYLDLLKHLWARDSYPKNVFLTAHVLTTEQTNIVKGTTTVSRRIVTAGNRIAAYIPAQFDEVWHFGVRPPDLGMDSARPKHLVWTEAIGDDYAKTAYNLPGMIDFTNKSLYEIIKNEISNEQPTKL